MANRNNAKGVAWVALIIALIALVLGWIAFNRTGADLNQRIETRMQEAVQEIEQTEVPEDVDVDVETGTSTGTGTVSS